MEWKSTMQGLCTPCLRSFAALRMTLVAPQDDTGVQPEIDSAPLMLDRVIKGRSYSDCRRVLDQVQTPQS